MRQLWKSTFGDSDAYLNIIFNRFLTPEYCLFIDEMGMIERMAPCELGYGSQTGDTDREEALQKVNSHSCGMENRGVAVLFAKEYLFIDNDADRPLRGLYLCGLATIPEYRRRGLMERLIKASEEMARKDGFDLLFLIPADNHLRHYYERLGFNTAGFLRRFLCQGKDLALILEASPEVGRDLKDFGVMAEFQLCEYINSEKSVEEKVIAEFLSKCELKGIGNEAKLLHSCADFQAAIAENRLSGGKVFLLFHQFKRGKLGRLKAVCFAESDGDEHLCVRALMGSEGKCEAAMLELLGRHVGLNKLVLRLDLRHPIWGLIDRGLERLTASNLNGGEDIIKNGDNDNNISSGQEDYLMVKWLSKQHCSSEKPISASLMMD